MITPLADCGAHRVAGSGNPPASIVSARRSTCMRSRKQFECPLRENLTPEVVSVDNRPSGGRTRMTAPIEPAAASKKIRRACRAGSGSFRRCFEPPEPGVAQLSTARAVSASDERARLHVSLDPKSHSKLSLIVTLASRRMMRSWGRSRSRVAPEMFCVDCVAGQSAHSFKDFDVALVQVRLLRP